MHLAIARRLPVLPPQRVWSEDQAAAEEEEEASLYFVMTDLAMRLLSMSSSSWGKAVDLTFQLQTTGTPSFVQSLVLTFSPRLLNRFPTRVVTLGAGDEGARDPMAYCMLSSVGCFPSPTQTKSCERLVGEVQEKRERQFHCHVSSPSRVPRNSIGVGALSPDR